MVWTYRPGRAEICRVEISREVPRDNLHAKTGFDELGSDGKAGYWYMRQPYAICSSTRSRTGSPTTRYIPPAPTTTTSALPLDIMHRYTHTKIYRAEVRSVADIFLPQCCYRAIYSRSFPPSRLPSVQILGYSACCTGQMHERYLAGNSDSCDLLLCLGKHA